MSMDDESGDARPPLPVVRAFATGCDYSDLVPLEGGQSTVWRAGSVVLKPLDMPVEALQWQADLVRSMDTRRFRLAAPELARDGRLVVDGWTAWPYLEGAHAIARWADIIAVGHLFHAAVSGCPRPDFLAARHDRWAIGDRVAWGETRIDPYLDTRHVADLAAHLRPVADRPQLVHADLTGNVLFHPTLPPAVIDVSPYWRPTPFASAVVVADALVWEGADESLLQAVDGEPRMGQYLLRALIFRLVAEHPARPQPAGGRCLLDPYVRAVRLAIQTAAQEA